MRERPKKLLGELLIEDGALSRENLSEALAHQKKSGGLIGQILIRLGYITEENLVVALGRQLDLPYLPLSQYAVNKDSVSLLDVDYCRRHFLIICDHDDKRIYMSTADPLNTTPIGEVEERFKRKVHLFLSTPAEIIQTLDTTFVMTAAKPEIKKAG